MYYNLNIPTFPKMEVLLRHHTIFLLKYLIGHMEWGWVWRLVHGSVWHRKRKGKMREGIRFWNGCQAIRILAVPYSITPSDSMDVVHPPRPFLLSPPSRAYSPFSMATVRPLFPTPCFLECGPNALYALNIIKVVLFDIFSRRASLFYYTWIQDWNHILKMHLFILS